MKKILLLFIIATVVIIYQLISFSNSGIFSILDMEVIKYSWGQNNFQKAAIFQEIYNKSHNDPDFENILFEYLDIDDKYYWIGIFLYSDYTDINNFDLSLKVLKKGLEVQKDEILQIRYYWAIGTTLYFVDRKEDAKYFLLKGDELSEKYPGNRPALFREESKEIDDFIESIKLN